MPVKRRVSKRRVNELDEMMAWEMVFDSGYDFFSELEPYGLREDKAIRRAARKAWRLYGARFLAIREPDPLRDPPWALRTFGPP